MKHQIRRIGVLSVAKIAFFIYWALGIVMALIYGSFFAMLSFFEPGQIDPELGEMTQFVGGLGAILVLLLGLFISIVYAVLGATAAALAVVAYNLLARIVGGVEMELVVRGESSVGGTSVVAEARRDRGVDTAGAEVVWTPVSDTHSSREALPLPPSSPSEPAGPDTRWRPPNTE